jgi:hypothetical protein
MAQLIKVPEEAKKINIPVNDDKAESFADDVAAANAPPPQPMFDQNGGPGTPQNNAQLQSKMKQKGAKPPTKPGKFGKPTIGKAKGAVLPNNDKVVGK